LACRLRLRAKFHSDWFIASFLRGKNSQILPHFQLQHSVMLLRGCSIVQKIVIEILIEIGNEIVIEIGRLGSTVQKIMIEN